MTFAIVFLSVFAIFFVTYLLGRRDKKHDYLDIIWGSGFVVAAVVSYFLGGHYTLLNSAMTLLVVIWGVRLTVHLAGRITSSKEDFRYQAYRNNYTGKHFELYFFFRMYLLQYALCMLIAFQYVYVNMTGNAQWSILSLLGVFVWLVGFYFEAVGDYQLRTFIKNPANKGKLMTEGLWRYTRHPNYFGEATQWWGIFLMVLSNFGNFWLIFSPVVITVLVRYVSGVPMLERSFEGHAGWQAYTEQTSVFIPMPPKKLT